MAGYLHAGETYREAAQRRQGEELGLTTALTERGKIEFHEPDAIKFVTLFSTEAADPEIREQQHISELRWWSVADLATDLDSAPDRFTPTFRQLFLRFGIGGDDRA